MLTPVMTAQDMKDTLILFDCLIDISIAWLIADLDGTLEGKTLPPDLQLP